MQQFNKEIKTRILHVLTRQFDNYGCPNGLFEYFLRSTFQTIPDVPLIETDQVSRLESNISKADQSMIASKEKHAAGPDVNRGEEEEHRRPGGDHGAKADKEEHGRIPFEVMKIYGGKEKKDFCVTLWDFAGQV